MQYDPYQHAKTLYDEGKIADADEFLTFYSEIPYVEISEPMRALHDEVREKRSSVMYHLSEMKRGLIEGESDEWLGQGVAFGTEFFFIGDVRDLSKQGIKYYKGEQVDKLTVGIASLGLAMSAVSSWGPQAAVGAPAKNSLGLFRRLSKTLKASMRKNIDDVAQVAYKLVKAQADKIAAKSSSFFDSVRKLDFSFIKKAWNSAPPIDEKVILKNADEVKMIDSAFTSLKKTGELYIVDRKAAAFIVSNTDDLNDLGRVADSAKKLGKGSGIMLENGGKGVLLAADKYQPSVIKESLAYGKGGVNYLLKKGSTLSLRIAVQFIKMTWTGKIWYYLNIILHMIPWLVRLAVAVYLTLVLCKTWFWRPIKKAA